MFIISLIRRFWPILAIIIVGVGVYFFNLQNPLFWDDDDWIINNTFVHDITWDNIKFWFAHNTLAGVGLPSNYYRPFLFFTFALNWVISGAEPFIWHLTSNIIHIANAVLVFLLLEKALADGRPWIHEGGPRGFLKLNPGALTAFLTALIFVIHPLNTEAVTYIAGRGDSLVMLFMLLALFFFLKSKDNPGRSFIYKSASLVSMTAGILSRETGITFPFLLMVFYIAFVDKIQIYKSNTNLQIANKNSLRDSQHSHDIRILASLKRAFKEAWLYFGTVLIYGILRLTVLNFQNTLNFYTVPNLYSENLLYRILTFMHVLVDYFRLLFVPTGLHMERSMTVHTSLFQWPVWLGFLMVVGIIYAGFILYRKENPKHEILNFKQNQAQNSKSKGIIRHSSLVISHFRVWFFGWGWFFVGLSMVSGVIPINAVMYEHWLYLPMIGFWTIIAFYLVKLLTSQVPSYRLAKLIIITALVVYLSFFGYQSTQRNILWGNPIEFFKDILKYEPQSARSNNNLGNLYFNQGDTEKALDYYRKSSEAEDIFPQPHFNIGSILQSRGDVFGAIKEYEKAIEVDPSFHYPYQNLLAIYGNMGDLIKATEYAEILKQLRPNDPRVFYNAALVYFARNDRDATLENLKQGLKVVGRDLEAEQLIRDLLGRIK